MITNSCGRVVRMLLALRHGQASLERGYSINKSLVCENQKDKLNCKIDNKSLHQYRWRC